MHEVIWKSAPDDHDYPAAAAYLSLHFKAKDILRASSLPLLPRENTDIPCLLVARDGSKTAGRRE